MVSTHGDPQSGLAVVLWVGNRLAHSCFCPLVLPTPAPRPSSFPCPTDPAKHLLTPASSQGSCPPPKGFSPCPHIGPFKGPYLPELLPTEGVLAFFLKGCSSVYPSHLTCKCEPPHAHLLPYPPSYSPPLLALQALSPPKLPCSRGVWSGGWPLGGRGKGCTGWGAWVRLRERKGREARERERQRQAASQPALYPCCIDPPCHSLVGR